MTPEAFVAKWKGVTLKERSAAQEHFIDLCRLLDEPTPAEADPTGSWYCFEKGAQPKPAAATAGRTCGGAAASAGSTRARARTSTPPSSSSSFTPRRWSTRRS